MTSIAATRLNEGDDAKFAGKALVGAFMLFHGSTALSLNDFGHLFCHL